jgi:hypothetical protein
MLNLWNMRTSRPQKGEQGQLSGKVSVHLDDFSLCKITILIQECSHIYM